MRWLKQQLRSQFQSKRRQLDPLEQQNSSIKIAQHLFQISFFQKAQRIGLYMAFAGEVLTSTILEQAIQQHKDCYVPLTHTNMLKFAKINHHTKLVANRFGILEPDKPLNLLAPQFLDLVLVPLVAFDKKGYRLGMGGGYYDKAFAFKKGRERPVLIGLAYDFQRVTKLPHSKFDLKLDIVVTDKMPYYFLPTEKH